MLGDYKRVMQKKEAKTAPISPMRSSKKGMTCARNQRERERDKCERRVVREREEERGRERRTSAMMNEKETTPTQREIQVIQ